ncbi:MAG: hypothetical protein JW724_07335 [Candidatus Altiarchaeota archaeon]|nr:hypothetical protein [Candidatus Altiarchaeota archaeon]
MPLPGIFGAFQPYLQNLRANAPQPSSPLSTLGRHMGLDVVVEVVVVVVEVVVVELVVLVDVVVDELVDVVLVEDVLDEVDVVLVDVVGGVKVCPAGSSERISAAEHATTPVKSIRSTGILSASIMFLSSFFSFLSKRLLFPVILVVIV